MLSGSSEKCETHQPPTTRHSQDKSPSKFSKESAIRGSFSCKVRNQGRPNGWLMTWKVCKKALASKLGLQPRIPVMENDRGSTSKSGYSQNSESVGCVTNMCRDEMGFAECPPLQVLLLTRVPAPHASTQPQDHRDSQNTHWRPRAILPKVKQEKRKRYEGQKIYKQKKTSSRWFKVPFSSPSWRSLNPLKGSLNHPKKVTLNHQVHNFSSLRGRHHTVIFFSTMKLEHIFLYKLHLRKTSGRKTIGKTATNVRHSTPIPPSPDENKQKNPYHPYHPIHATFPCEAQHTSRQVNSCDFGKITTRFLEKRQQGTWQAVLPGLERGSRAGMIPIPKKNRASPVPVPTSNRVVLKTNKNTTAPIGILRFRTPKKQLNGCRRRRNSNFQS